MLQYAITDRRFFPGDERQRTASLVTQAQLLSHAGVDYLQLREKDLSPAYLLPLALALRRALPPGTNPRLLLNGPAELALKAGADGLHLPAGWATADLAAARSLFHAAGRPAPVLSISAHSLSEVQAACAAAVDLILFGPVLEKRVRGDLVQPGVGLAALAEAARTAAPVPLLALGGITPATIPACLAAGAAGIAAIRLFLPADWTPDANTAAPAIPSPEPT